MLWNREPILWMGLIRSAVVLVTLFGLELTVEQTAGVYLFAEAVLSFMARSRVSPTT